MTYKIFNEATGKVFFFSHIKHADLSRNHQEIDYNDEKGCYGPINGNGQEYSPPEVLRGLHGEKK